MKTRTNIERFRDAVENNKFTMDEELKFIEILLSKYNFISKSEYARKEGVSPQGVKARLISKSEPYIEVIGKVFILS